jgi:integrase
MFGTPVNKKVACVDFQIYKISKGKKVTDLNKLETIINEYGIPPRGDNDTEKESLHLALNLIHLKGLYIKHGSEWMDKFLLSESLFPENPLVRNLRPENFMYDEYFPLNPTAKIKEELSKVGQRLNKAPAFDKRKAHAMELGEVTRAMFTAGTIRVYCKECRKTGSKCAHPLEKKVYQARFYVPNDSREKKTFLTARYADDAIVEVANKYNNLKETGYNSFSAEDKVKNKKLHYVHEAVEAFISFKKNEEKSVFVSALKYSKQYIADLECRTRKLPEMLAAIGMKTCSVQALGNKELVTKLVKKLQEQKGRKAERLAPASYNSVISYWTSLIKWLNAHHGMSIFNAFAIVAQMPSNYTPRAIADDQFDKLIKWMRTNPKLPEHKYKHVAASDLNWLRQTFTLQKLITCRREDILMLKWSDIVVIDKTYFLRVVNHKKTRLRKSEVPLVDFHPVTTEIMKVLIELGFKKKQDPNDFIIMSEKVQGKGLKKANRETLMKKLSIGFTLLTKECFGEAMQNKTLRKSNITDLSVVHQGDPRVHENIATTDKHYIDKLQQARKMAKGMKNLVKAA